MKLNIVLYEQIIIPWVVPKAENDSLVLFDLFLFIGYFEVVLSGLSFAGWHPDQG
jgi:hypothetical protein